MSYDEKKLRPICSPLPFNLFFRLKTRENVDDGDLEEGFKTSSKTTAAKEEDLDKNRMTLIASPNKVSAPTVGGNVHSSSIPKSTVAAVWQKQNTTEEVLYKQ